MEQGYDLRIQRTYRSLSEAFTQLMEEKRFEDITVGELCERAMIRRTTFYKHFADKYEYFSFYIKEMRDTFESELPPDIAAYHAEDYFISMGEALYHFINEHEKFVDNIIESNLLNSLFDILYDLVKRDLTTLMWEERKKDEHPMKHVECEFTAAFFAGGLLCALRWWRENHIPVSREEFTEAVRRLTKTNLGRIFSSDLQEKPPQVDA